MPRPARDDTDTQIRLRHGHEQGKTRNAEYVKKVYHRLRDYAPKLGVRSRNPGKAFLRNSVKVVRKGLLVGSVGLGSILQFCSPLIERLRYSRVESLRRLRGSLGR